MHKTKHGKFRPFKALVFKGTHAEAHFHTALEILGKLGHEVSAAGFAGHGKLSVPTDMRKDCECCFVKRDVTVPVWTIILSQPCSKTRREMASLGLDPKTRLVRTHETLRRHPLT